MGKSRLLKILRIPAIAIILAGCVTTKEPSYSIKKPEKPQTINFVSKEIPNVERKDQITIKKDRKNSIIKDAPIYNYNKEMCAAYAVRVSRNLYGKKMIYGDAWDVVYENKKIAEIENEKHLRNLVDKKVLRPGMIIGTYYPFSRFLNNGVDKKGKKRRYTHLVVFAGINNEGELTFYHQFKNKTEKITLNNLKKKCPKLIEIIDEK